MWIVIHISIGVYTSLIAAVTSAPCPFAGGLGQYKNVQTPHNPLKGYGSAIAIGHLCKIISGRREA